MARKVGQAVAGGIGGYAIGAVGYNAALDVQSARTLEGIHMLATFVPAVMYIVVFLILLFLYPLNKKRTLQLSADLADRRKG
jgi:GPH family glycoside/pentoside/hexuronide:cation symporter